LLQKENILDFYNIGGKMKFYANLSENEKVKIGDIFKIHLLLILFIGGSYFRLWFLKISSIIFAKLLALVSLSLVLNLIPFMSNIFNYVRLEEEYIIVNLCAEKKRYVLSYKKIYKVCISSCSHVNNMASRLKKEKYIVALDQNNEYLFACVYNYMLWNKLYEKCNEGTEFIK